MLLGQARVDDHRHWHRQIRQGQLVGLEQVQAEGVIVHHLELLRLLQRTGFHLKGRKATDRHRAVEGPLHILGCDRTAIVETRVLAQKERHRLAVRGDLQRCASSGFSER